MSICLPTLSRRALTVGLLACSMMGSAVPVLAASTAPADVQVTNAWIRATVKGQSGTGGFMTLQSTKGATLLGLSSQVAKLNQLHEMAMEGDVMRMREIAAIELPAGQAVDLKPGGMHIMLIGLKKTLKPGVVVPVQLKLRDAAGKTYQHTLRVPVKAAMAQGDGSSTAPASQPAHDHAMHH